jgi:hypothetical protein
LRREKDLNQVRQNFGSRGGLVVILLTLLPGNEDNVLLKQNVLLEAETNNFT